MIETRDTKYRRSISEFLHIAKAVENLPPAKRRKHLSQHNWPRHLYKFRRSLHDSSLSKEQQDDARRNFDHIFLDNQLWMASPLDFNDPFDASMSYRSTESASEYRKTITKYIKRLERERGVKFPKGQLSEYVASRKFDKLLNDGRENILRKIGVCCLSASPRNPLMWAHYASEHKGFCIQFRPDEDVVNMPFQEVTYDDTFPIITDPFTPARAGGSA